MWHIVADSSCDLFQLPERDEGIDFSDVPFTIHIDDVEYFDDDRLSVDQMLTANEGASAPAHTACPSPDAWLGPFSAPGPVVAFTISSALSGSYNSACVARDMLLEQQPDKPIAIVDTKSTGPETVMLIKRAIQLIRQGTTPAELGSLLSEEAERIHIAFALSSFHNLIKAGRVNRLIGFIAGHLGFWGIGAGDEKGEINIRGKARGMHGMIRFMLEEIKKTGLAGKHVVICHCQNEKGASLLKESLCEAFRNITVDILPTRGLDSYYAERHGLIVAY